MEKACPLKSQKLIIGHSLPLCVSDVCSIKQESLFPFAKIKDKLIHVFTHKGRYYAQIVSTFFKVDAVIHDLDTGLFYDRLLIETRFGYSTAIVEKERLSKKRFEEIGSLGLFIDSNAIPFLLDYIAMQEEQAQTITQYSNVGWGNRGNQLQFYGYECSPEWCYTGDKGLVPRGSFEEDCNELSSLVCGSVGLTVALTASLSSALIGLFAQTGHSIESMLVHFYGNSSCGKSTGLQLGASLWGNGEMGKGILNSWNSTDNALLTRMNGNFGIVMCLDESSVVDRDFSSAIYRLSQGSDKTGLPKMSVCKKQKNLPPVYLAVVKIHCLQIPIIMLAYVLAY